MNNGTLQSWKHHNIQELFFDERKDPDVMNENFAGPPILKDEVRAATKKMKNGKATGPDGICCKGCYVCELEPVPFDWPMAAWSPVGSNYVNWTHVFNSFQ